MHKVLSVRLVQQYTNVAVQIFPDYVMLTGGKTPSSLPLFLAASDRNLGVFPCIMAC